MNLAEGISVERPDHDAAATQRVPARIVTSWPAGTFVENLLARDDGSIVVSVHSEGRLELVTPDGERKTWKQFDAGTTGLSMVGNDLFVSVGHPGRNNWAIHRVERDGRSEKLVDVPEALFLNGSTPFRGTSIMVVDSILGRAIEVDTRAAGYTTWLDHDLLRKITAEPMMPGVNGVKTYSKHVYFSCTERALLLRASVSADGGAGSLEVVAERFVGDDFAFDVHGDLYVATHVHNQVQKLATDGKRTVVAGIEEWMNGSTAISFGRRAPDERAIYVTTTGGILAPVEGRLQEAKLVRLDVGVEGAQLQGIQ
jgi:hypothetical protein